MCKLELADILHTKLHGMYLLLQNYMECTYYYMMEFILVDEAQSTNIVCNKPLLYVSRYFAFFYLVCERWGSIIATTYSMFILGTSRVISSCGWCCDWFAAWHHITRSSRVKVSVEIVGGYFLILSLFNHSTIESNGIDLVVGSLCSQWDVISKFELVVIK